jgi:hypothetical protein
MHADRHETYERGLIDRKVRPARHRSMTRSYKDRVLGVLAEVEDEDTSRVQLSQGRPRC